MQLKQNADYFAHEINGKTLYEMDKNISTTFQSNKLIDKYADSFTLYASYQLDILNLSYIEIAYTNDFKSLLKEWKKLGRL